jgi:hypothetical protein
MRDHIYHMDLMLAGMWGGKAGVLPNLRQRLLAMPKYFNNRFADQSFLMNEVWPLIRDDVFTLILIIISMKDVIFHRHTSYLETCNTGRLLRLKIARHRFRRLGSNFQSVAGLA